MENTNTGNITAEALTPQEDQIAFLTFQGAKFKEELTQAQTALGNQIHESLNLMSAWRDSITAQITAYNAAAEAGKIFPLFPTGDTIETIGDILDAWKENNTYEYEDEILAAVDCELSYDKGWNNDEVTISIDRNVGDCDSLLDKIKRDILECFREEGKQ